MLGLKKTACALLVSLGVLLAWCSEGLPHGVLIIQSRDVGPFREAIEGLSAVLESEGVHIHLCTDGPCASGQREALVDSIDATGVSVLVTVGTVVTEQILRSELGLPVVFCMVLDPVGRGFVQDLEHPGGWATGVALDIPIDAQFQALKETVPDAHRVGVLFSTPRNQELVQEARGVAEKLGLTLVPAEITSEEAVPRVLRNLTSEIDALWGIADPIAFSNVSTEHLILHTIRNRIPFMGLSASFVKAGALLALSCDYRDIGRQAGETVLKILQGQNPREVPVSFPRTTALHLSLRTARLIGTDIPTSVIEKACEVRE